MAETIEDMDKEIEPKDEEGNNLAAKRGFSIEKLLKQNKK